MGIAGYLRTIVAKYPEIHSSVVAGADYLMFDFNGIIYGAVAAVLAAKNSVRYVGKNIDHLIIKEVLAAADRLIASVKPRKGIFIAVDGVVPMAKIHEQRKRAYAAMLRRAFASEASEASETPLKLTWNTMQIKPGTDFMIKLDKELRKHFAGRKTVISGHDEPGEGEHKIMKYAAKLTKGASIAIFSPDADMLILIGKVPRHNYTIITNVIPKDIQKMYVGSSHMAVDASKFNEAMTKEYGAIDLGDFAFFTMLAGDDFVRAFIYTRMNAVFAGKNTFELLTEIYTKLRATQSAGMIERTGGLKINRTFLQRYVAEIAKNEINYLRELQRKYQNVAVNARRNAESKKTMTAADYRMMTYEHYEPFKTASPLNKKYGEQFRRINYYAPETVWKKQYYEFFFPRGASVRDICREYLRSLEFAITYYLAELPSWTYVYPYIAAPLPSDFAAYLSGNANANRNTNGRIRNRDKFKLGTPISVVEQMLHYITREDVELLPAKYRAAVLADRVGYPEVSDVAVNVVQGQKMIYAEIVLPPLRVKT